jgi:hypothetical protein
MLFAKEIRGGGLHPCSIPACCGVDNGPVEEELNLGLCFLSLTARISVLLVNVRWFVKIADGGHGTQKPLQLTRQRLRAQRKFL